MKSATRHDLVWMTALAACTAAFLVVVVRPQFGKARELKESLRREQQLVAEGRSDLEQLPHLQEEVNRLRRQVDGFERQVPQRDELGEYLGRLAGIAERHALRPEAIEPGTPVRLNDLYAVPIVLKVHGPFQAVYGLLKDIEGLPRLTQVQRFDATVASDRPGQVRTEMELKVFYRAS